ENNNGLVVLAGGEANVTNGLYALNSENGAKILAGGEATFAGSIFQRNTLDGALVNGTATMTNVQAIENKLNGVNVAGTATIYDSTLSRNEINGLDVENGVATIVDSYVQENKQYGVRMNSTATTATVIKQTLVTDNVLDGVVLAGGKLETYNATIANNAKGEQYKGYAVKASAGEATLFNTIAALSGESTDVFADEGATVTGVNVLANFDEWTANSANTIPYSDLEGQYIFADGNYAADKNYQLYVPTTGDELYASRAINAGEEYYGDKYLLADWPTVAGGKVDLADAPRVNVKLDLGAYEAQGLVPETPSIIVTTLDDVVDRYDHRISLREAIEVYFDWTTPFDATETDQYAYNLNNEYFRKYAKKLGETETDGLTITFDLTDYFTLTGKDPTAPYVITLANGRTLTVANGMTIDASVVRYGAGENDVVANGRNITVNGAGSDAAIMTVSDEYVASIDVAGKSFDGLTLKGLKLEKTASGVVAAADATIATITVETSEIIATSVDRDENGNFVVSKEAVASSFGVDAPNSAVVVKGSIIG
ncbi:MAG: right-handed parallel beta-helix repeat-containing protein, partial [Thermoguttaceae bacterium]|nr:right-handed parallel beta-helix repeat-containing protein [Thermoguttaceae bacterium]